MALGEPRLLPLRRAGRLSGSVDRGGSPLQVPVHTVAGTALVYLTRRRSDCAAALGRGLRLGLAVPGGGAGVAATTALRGYAAKWLARELPKSARLWLLVRIPVGTCGARRRVPRGVCTVASRVRARWGRLLQAAAFGLSHVAGAAPAGHRAPNARGSRERCWHRIGDRSRGCDVCWLYARSGSWPRRCSPNLAINEAGAVAALAVQRR